MTQTGNLIAAKTIRITGLVQGVGFRPFIWRLARETGVTGHVLNDGAGVQIEIHGRPDSLSQFVWRLRPEQPVLARIDRVKVRDAECDVHPDDFRILESREGGVQTGVVPDAATCPDCLAEINDPCDRRYRYAFTNCTHCGPRLSILRHIPYDRASTSMAVFDMCPACRAEYENPADRRFHAQPTACPDCGPRLWFEGAEGGETEGDPITVAAGWLRQGKILAVKGLGGFQIAVDAANEEAVAELRRRKHRPAKPLALMARDLDQIRKHALVCDAEAALLQRAAAPIVLLEKAGCPLADSVAGPFDRLGVMLPNTPLHHLLMAELDGPIVLTSGNLSDNPQETDNAAARRQLASIVDGFLMHDREIVNRLDDSVVRLDELGLLMQRRARGYAPASIRLANVFQDAPKVLAMGGELKATFCLLNGQDAILSQHIGDLENAPTFADYKRLLTLYLDLYEFRPEVIAIDAHPQYLSSRYGEELAREFGAKLVKVQHHHAHLASVMAERQIPPQGIDYGIILDGLGWGADGTIWGGEILKGSYAAFERVGHFQPVPLPGGAAAIREPWRNLVAHLRAAFGTSYREHLDGTGLSEALSGKNTGMLEQMMERGVNAPLSSSAGRLFDAVAAALGISFDRQSFEGEAGMRLEALARPFMDEEMAYPLDIAGGEPLRLCFAPLWRALLTDLRKGVSPGRISARFHLGLVEGVVGILLRVDAKTGDAVMLSGGVLQNALLRERLPDKLRRERFKTITHWTVPANDGGLALGQAAIAAVQCGHPAEWRHLPAPS
ncbi:carbamoyltransferase HypF [Roseibium sediminicola]|uniref:Carbamoyltransferase HypF n=1 Tax=Roseibium sediminicola TaxID=2933272 RepID=A0ABT0GTZ7_9HYPH|nr:carbamoyltransferase HypF [Roseibium sp. CAU 1639]